MSTVKALLLIAMAALVAVPAFASTTDRTIDEISNIGGGDGSELALYEIVNQVYGPSGNGLFGTDFVNNADLASIELTSDDVFNLGHIDVSLRARIADWSQLFGVYYPAGAVAPTYEGLLTLTGGTHNGDVLDDTWYNNNVALVGQEVAQATIVGPFGFFDQAPIATGNTLHSEIGLNADGLDHMVAMVLSQTATETVYLLAFEDGGNGPGGTLGDNDYNDFLVEVTVPVLPEPASLSLLGLGLAGFAIRRKFARR